MIRKKGGLGQFQACRMIGRFEKIKSIEIAEKLTV